MTDTAYRKAPHDDGEPPSPPRRQPLLGLSPIQVLGGALAAITAAVVSSYLGVAGTLIGAALASIVSTVGSALYTQSMHRANGLAQAGVRRLGPRRGGARAVPDPSARADLDRRDGSATPRRPDSVTPDPTSRREPRAGRRIWFGAAAIFVLALAAITGVELLTGKPVSAVVDGGTSRGTTIGSVVAPAAAPTDTSPTRPGSEPTSTDTDDSGVTPDPGDVATQTPGRATATPTSPDRAPTTGTTTAPTGAPTGSDDPTARTDPNHDGSRGTDTTPAPAATGGGAAGAAPTPAATP